VRVLITHALKGGATCKAASVTHVHFDKDNREHYIHVVCHPLFDEQGMVHR
jgi:hypothetical protein